MVWTARLLPTTAAPNSTDIIQVRRVRVLLQPYMSLTRAQKITLRKTTKTHTMKKVESLDRCKDRALHYGKPMLAWDLQKLQ
jgi:hypothetical protein